LIFFNCSDGCRGLLVKSMNTLGNLALAAFGRRFADSVKMLDILRMVIVSLLRSDHTRVLANLFSDELVRQEH